VQPILSRLQPAPKQRLLLQQQQLPQLRQQSRLKLQLQQLLPLRQLLRQQRQ
jgi:hypothetical protein